MLLLLGCKGSGEAGGTGPSPLAEGGWGAPGGGSIAPADAARKASHPTSNFFLPPPTVLAIHRTGPPGLAVTSPFRYQPPVCQVAQLADGTVTGGGQVPGLGVLVIL